MGRGAITGRVERGSLRQVHRGVYAVGHRVINVNGRRKGAVLACGPEAEAVLSHRSAARLWGIAPPSTAAIEISCGSGRHVRRPGILTHRMSFAADEIDEVLGIPVTSVFRTVFDLAAIAPMREVERAFHEAEVRRLTDRVSLPLLLERYPGHRGVVTVRAILAGREPIGITDRELEERFLAFLDAHGFPRPLLNATLPLRGRLLRPDCMWREERLIVELDGREVHATDRAFESDRRRDRELLAEGWRSSRVTWRQLRDEPAAIAADLRRLLG